MEIELKYACPNEAALSSLLEEPALQARMLEPVRVIEMRTRYFDTTARDLRARHWTLRLRQENDVTIATFKNAGEKRGALSSHGEWETKTPALEQAVPALIELGAPAELREFAAKGLVQTCSAEFTRRCVRLSLPDGSVAELCCDQGMLCGAVERMPLCEVELELISGEVDALLAFGEAFALQYGLQPEVRSKLARALSLK